MKTLPQYLSAYIRALVAAVALLLGSAHGAPLALNEPIGTGWNLAGNSSDTPLDVAATFTAGGSAGKVVSVWVWNAAQARWAFYSPQLTAGALSAYIAQKGYDLLQTIPPGSGYWINASAAFSLPARSVNPVSGLDLQSAWNLGALGQSLTVSSLSSAIKSASGNDPVTVWAWDNAQGNWFFYAPSQALSGGLSQYIAQKGYLDFGSQARALDPGTGFWVNSQAVASVPVVQVATTGSALTGTVYPPIAGLRYHTATQDGYVAADGSYAFLPGEQVTFSIGGASIAGMPAKSQVIPMSLEDPVSSSNFLRLVKALDADGNLANGISLPPLAGTNTRTVPLDDEAAVAALLSQINAAAVLPSANDSQVTALLASVQAKQGTMLGTYGANYDSFYVRTVQCGTTNLPRRGTVRLTSQPNWATGALTGDATLTLGDGSTLAFGFANRSGTAISGTTSISYRFNPDYTVGSRVIHLKLYVGGSSLCNYAEVALRDNAQPNRPPVVSRGYIRWSPDILGVGFSVYTFEGSFGGYGLVREHGIANDSDGQVVSLKWETSKGASGTSYSSTTNPNLGGENIFSVQVFQNEKVDITFTATDDQGATSQYKFSIGTGSLDERLQELADKWFVRHTESSDSQGIIYSDSQYYRYDSASQTVSQTLCLDQIRAGASLPGWAIMAGITGAKQCWESTTPASDPMVKEALNNMVPEGSGALVYRDPTAGGATMRFTQTDTIPAGYKVYDDNHTLVRTTDGSSSGPVLPTPAPVTGGGSWADSGSGTGTGGNAAAQACASSYAGPKDDPQFDSFCMQAQFDACLDKATGTTTYKKEASAACTVLDGLIRATSSTYSCRYCPYGSGQ